MSQKVMAACIYNVVYSIKLCCLDWLRVCLLSITPHSWDQNKIWLALIFCRAYRYKPQMFFYIYFDHSGEIF